MLLPRTSETIGTFLLLLDTRIDNSARHQVTLKEPTSSLLVSVVNCINYSIMETEITTGFPKITLFTAKIKIGEIINN